MGRKGRRSEEREIEKRSGDREVKRVATEEKGNGENRNGRRGRDLNGFKRRGKEEADMRNGGEGKDGDEGKRRETESIGRREKESKCDRIAPSHPLSWPCVSDLLATTFKARAGYARKPSMTRLHNEELVN